jgi:endonuclease/exonuclease/phosphatase family metal-dependent hydrolase
MRIVTYNILDGGEGRADPIAEVILAQKPDIVALTEADNLAVLERLSMRLKMDYVQAVGQQHATAILSRWTIRESVNHAALHADFAGSSLEVLLESPGANWRIAVVDRADVFGGAQVLAGTFDINKAAAAGFTGACVNVSGGTYSTQNPAEIRDFIFTRGIDSNRIKCWIETDRLAKYASDHFPLVAEIV